MKRKLILLSGIILAAALVACNNQEDAIPNPAVSTEKATYELPAQGGEVDFTFRCNMPWEIQVLPGNAKSDVSGIRVTPSSGKGSDKDITVKVKASTNEGDKRVAIISVNGTGFAAAAQFTQASINAPAGPEKGVTLALPYKSSELAQSILNGDIPMGQVYVRGVVSKVQEVSAQYGNITLWITDDGNDSDLAFEFFRGKSFGGASITEADEANPPVKVGDTITALGEATLYGSTPEFKAGCVLIGVNGLAAPVGEGTLESPYNIAKAMEATIAAGEAGTGDVYIKGIISEIKEVSVGYGNATYWLSDDGFQPGDNKTVMQVYRGYSFGGDKFTEEDAIKLGDEVVLKGRLIHYKSDTPEVAQGGALVLLNGKPAAN